MLKLNAVGDVAFGIDQEIARQTDDPLIRTATGRGWQFGRSGIRYINTNDGEVAVVEFPNVGATNGLLATPA